MRTKLIVVDEMFSHPLSFTRPPVSVALAEFFGVMMGDGGMTQYQITITLHHINDLEYAYFVRDLATELFGVPANIHHHVRDSIVEVQISRKKLVGYLYSLGLPVGNKVKQRFDMPDWIKENKKYRLACVRGLVDTDGSVFNHRYTVGGKEYSYKKLDFASLSPPLLMSVKEVMEEVGLRPRLNGGKKVCLDSIADMQGYFAKIGSHNPKHLKRYYG